MLRNNSNSAVLATILYSDIFDYPLTEKEIHEFQISNKQITKKMKPLVHRGIVSFKSGFYCLKGREEIIKKRIKRNKISEEKIAFAKKITERIRYIPTVRLIGLSGSVAVLNADEDDDIDFFIICQAGTIWVTRFFILILLHVLGVRRKRQDLWTKNKICMNMFIDECSLLLPEQKQNLYTAHEVVQMRPLFNKKNTYELFLAANRWVTYFLPNIFLKCENPLSREIPLLQRGAGGFVEFFAKKFQLWYMRKYRTTEFITNTLLAFHPKDHAQKVLKEYEERIKYYGL